MPVGWSATSTQQQYQWAIVRDTREPNSYLRGYFYGSSYSSCKFELTSPVMDFSQGSTMLSFRYRNPGRGGTLSIYLSKDGGTTFSYISGSALRLSDSQHATDNSWAYYSFDLTAAAEQSSNVVVRLHLEGSGSSFETVDLHIDDLHIRRSTSCTPAESGPRLTAVSSDRAYFEWSGMTGVTGWMVRYDLTETATNTVVSRSMITTDTTLSVPTVAGTPYAISGSIAPVCGPGDTADFITFHRSFTTPCQAVDLPYFLDFNCLPDSVKPDCWTDNMTDLGTNTSTLSKPWIVADSSFMLTCYPNKECLITAESPMFAIPQGGTATWQFDCTSMEQNRNLVVAVRRAGERHFRYIDTLTVAKDATVHQSYDLSAYAGDTVQLYMANKFSRQGVNFAIDNLSISAGCDTVPTVTVSDTTRCSAVFNIGDNIPAPWQVAISRRGEPVANAELHDGCGASLEVEHLVVSTEYDVRIRRICAPGDTSAWSEPVAFHTEYHDAQVPYACSFEDTAEITEWVTCGASTSSICTHQFYFSTDTAGVYDGQRALYVANGNSSVTTVSDNVTHDYAYGSYQLYAYRTIAFESKSYEIDYLWKCTTKPGTSASSQTRNYPDKYNHYGRVFLVPAEVEIVPSVGSTIDRFTIPDRAIPLDPAGVVQLQDSKKKADLERGWQSYHGVIDLTGRAGNYNLVVMWVQNAHDEGTPLAIDRIGIREHTCTEPEVVFYDDAVLEESYMAIDSHDAERSEMVIDTKMLPWNVEPVNPLYRLTVTNDTFDLSFLEPHTEYYYMLRATCRDSVMSHYTYPRKLLTRCGIKHLPYRCDFDNSNVSNTAQKLANEGCWNIFWSEGGSPSSYNVWQRYSEDKNENRSLLLHDTCTVFAALPYIEDLNHSVVTFKACYSKQSDHLNNCGYGSFGYMTDIYDTATYTKLIDIPHNSYFRTFTVPLDTLPSHSRLVFKYEDAKVNIISYEFAIDDVSVDFRKDTLVDTTGTYLLEHSYDTVDHYFAVFNEENLNHLRAEKRQITVYDQRGDTSQLSYSFRYDIPEYVEGNGRRYPVTTLGNNAFQSFKVSKMVAIALPRALDSIGDNPEATYCYFLYKQDSAIVICRSEQRPKFTTAPYRALNANDKYFCMLPHKTPSELAEMRIRPDITFYHLYHCSEPYNILIEGGLKSEDVHITLPIDQTPASIVVPKADIRQNEDGVWTGIQDLRFTANDSVSDAVVTDTSFTAQFRPHARLAVTGRYDARIRVTDNTVVHPDIHNSPALGTDNFFAGLDRVYIEVDRYRAPSWSIEPVTSMYANAAYQTTTDLCVEHTIDQARYYWISQPFDVKLKDVIAIGRQGDTLPLLTDDLDQAVTVARDSWVIYEYSEQQRTTDALGQSYRQLTDPDAVLARCHGYAVAVVESDDHIGQTVEARLLLPSGRGIKELGASQYAGYRINQITKSGDNWWNGWNLVGNPFMQRIPGSAFGKYINVIEPDRPDIVRQYRTDLNRITLSPFVGFAVQASVPGYLSVNPTLTADPQSLPAAKPGVITITLTSADSTSDATSLVNSASAQDEYVIGEDLAKIINPSTANIYLHNDSIRFAFSELSIGTDERVFPLGMTVARAGTYTIALDHSMTDFAQNIHLHDLATGLYHDLNQAPYSLELDEGETDHRIEIVTGRIRSSATATTSQAVEAYIHSDRIEIETGESQAEVYIYDAQGRLMHHEAADGRISYVPPTRGVYMIAVRQAGGVTTMKVVY